MRIYHKKNTQYINNIKLDFMGFSLRRPLGKLVTGFTV